MRSVGTAVAVCWHSTAMALAPAILVRHWPLEGGAVLKPIGLNVKEIDTKDGILSVVKLEKNSDW